MGVVLAWIKKNLSTAKHHLALTLTLLVLGFLGGYYAAEIEQRRTRIFSGTAGYRQLSDGEVKQKAMDVVVELRSFIKAINKEHTDIDLGCQRDAAAATSDEIRLQIRQRCNDQSFRLADKHVQTYNERFKSEALILAEELLHRLPTEYKAKVPVILFQYPTNSLGMENVATTLEILAKSLPNR
jgi:hypothetical protein